MFVTCPGCGTTKALERSHQAGDRLVCSQCERLFALALGDDVMRFEWSRSTRLRCPTCGVDYLIGGADFGAAVYCRPCQRVWTVQSNERAARDGEPDVVQVAAGKDDGLEPTPLFDLATPQEQVLTLLDAVCHALPDDAPRLVLADCLLELNDRLGEFMVLQLTAGQAGPVGAAKAREVELLKEHGSLWVPPGVDPSTARFHRGLLQSCHWSSETDARHFAWRTVETLHLDAPYPGLLLPQTPFGVSSRPALHTLTGVEFFHGTYLSRCSLPHLRVLEFVIGHVPWLDKALEMLPRFPSLRALSLTRSSYEPPDFEVRLPELERICVAVGPMLTSLRIRAPSFGDEALARMLRRHGLGFTIELLDAQSGQVLREVSAH